MPFQNATVAQVVTATVSPETHEDNFRIGLAEIIEKADVAPRSLFINGTEALTDNEDNWVVVFDSNDPRITAFLQAAQSGQVLGVMVNDDGTRTIVPQNVPGSSTFNFNERYFTTTTSRNDATNTETQTVRLNNEEIFSDGLESVVPISTAAAAPSGIDADRTPGDLQRYVGTGDPGPGLYLYTVNGWIKV